MSIYMTLYCPETKLSLWMGEWRNWADPLGHQLYGDDENWEKLDWFLTMHRGKEIRYLDDCGGENSEPPDAIQFEKKHWIEFLKKEIEGKTIENSPINIERVQEEIDRFENRHNRYKLFTIGVKHRERGPVIIHHELNLTKGK